MFKDKTLAQINHRRIADSSPNLFLAQSSLGKSLINCVYAISTILITLVDLVRFSLLNRPFYSCVLSYLAMNASEAGGELALIRTSLLFSCKCKLVSIRAT